MSSDQLGWLQYGMHLYGDAPLSRSDTMAAPLKRVYHGVIGQSVRWQAHSRSQWPSVELSKCQNLCHFERRILCRHYTQTSRLQAQQEASTDDYEDILEEGAAYLEELPDESEMSSAGYAELEAHRELREMVRVAAWEMPLLSSLSKPFEVPNRKKQPLRWRYTTYFGEAHPNSRKVVVSFFPADLTDLNAEQRLKLCKLAGTRYNPSSKVVRMGCDNFETPAQNKRYLGDIVGKLIEEAKNGEDMFEDVPLDTRHHRALPKLQFPEEWLMTKERKEELEWTRRTSLLKEAKRVEENKVVSGVAAIEAARQIALQQAEQAVMVEARQPLPRGKQGKKEMGQTKRSQRF